MPPNQLNPMSNCALIADSICKVHDTGRGHPESPSRFDAVFGALETSGLVAKTRRIEPRTVTREDLLLAHTTEYLALAEGEILSGEDQLSTGDTLVSDRSWEAATKAAGSALAAVDAVMRGEVTRAFCVVRPPGHHASASRGMGFCVLNNVALAARHAQRRHGIERVLIVDWDVHHGNGTQDIFYADGSVFFFSTHQSPWYPGTGRADEIGSGAGKGTTLNCPLPAGSGRKEIFAAFDDKLLPSADAFRPQFVLISAGFDSRAGDPLGEFRLTDEDFAELTHKVRAIADRHAQGRVVSMLEGGYNLTGLASAAQAHVGALL
jgi:acetoin utilization deacetylase AcuC-like enzyme